MKTETSYEDKIMAWMRSKGGDVVLVSALAKRFAVGESSILALMNEMAASGKIRHAPHRNKRSIGFYIPTEAQINAERRMAQEVKLAAPLKVDNHRRELYARLKAERNSIRSIG